MRVPLKIKAERVADGHVITFNSLKEAAAFAGIPISTMSVRIRTNIPDSKGWIYTPVDCKILPKPKEKRRIPKKTVYKDDDVELNREKYHIVPYQALHHKVCITPCPFLLAPKPFVGSVKCEMCTNFICKDSESKIVICSHSKCSHSEYKVHKSYKKKCQRLINSNENVFNSIKQSRDTGQNQPKAM